MTHKKHTSRRISKRAAKPARIVHAPVKKVSVKVLPLEELQRKFANAGPKTRDAIRTDLDTKLEPLEDLDFPDVAIFTVEGQPIEKVAELLDKSPTAIKAMQREINQLLAA